MSITAPGPPPTMVTLGRGFFDLQFQFARTASALGGLPLPRALLEYTNLYIRFGLGRAFDPAHPGWQEYLVGLNDASDPLEWTHRFYLTRPPASTVPNVVATAGCFSYARLSTDRIRLHFHDAETEGRSPLAIDRRERRMAELAALFQHVRRAMPDSPRVVGASWLYNLDAYRGLFPASYLATARVLPHRFQHMPLWGQFVSRSGKVRQDMARQFLNALGSQSRLDDLDQCFPLQVLGLEAPAEAFYELYGIS